MKAFIIIATLYACWFTTFSSAKAQCSAITNQTDSLKTITLKVKGITCANDLKTISTNVEKIKGVKKCSTGKKGATTSFEIKFNPIIAKEKEIIDAIEGTEGCENPKDRPYKVKN